MSSSKHRLSSDVSVVAAASILLAHYLERVHQRLELAAKEAADDIEHIHQLRISTRRSIAALNLFRDYLPAKRRKRITKRLIQIRRVAAAARDLDVLIEKQKASQQKDTKLIKHLLKKRKKAQKPVVETYKCLYTTKTFEDDCRSLVKRVKKRNCDDGVVFRNWAKHRLPKISASFFRWQPANVADLSQLHRFRIAAKKLRYSLDLLEPAFPKNALNPLLSDVKQLQDILGKINDRAVAIKRIRRMKAKGFKVKKHLLKDEIASLQSLKRKFARAWNKDNADQMRRKFDQLIAI